MGFLQETSNNTLGSARQLALHHTIVPYYLAFATAELRSQTIDRMRGKQIAALKFSLGLLTSGFRANHPLKACRLCEREDLANHGVAYWHRSHQYPTILVCPTHREPLWFDRSKSDGVARFEWLLPDSVPARLRKEISIKNLPANLADLMKLATLSIEVAEFGAHRPLEKAQLQTTVRRRLSALDFVTQNGSIRQRALGEDYFRTYGYLGSVELLRGLPTSATGGFRPSSSFASQGRGAPKPRSRSHNDELAVDVVRRVSSRLPGLH